jgi:hypothetical protein
MAAITGLPSPGMDWREPIFKYLQLGTMSDDETETQHLVRRAKGYLIHNVELYHCSTSGILQQCIPVKEGKALLLDIHKGVYGHHASSRSMVGKVFWQGFYWWMANGDVAQIVRSCRGCQYFARQIHTLTQDLQTIPITWLFAMSGLDLLGPFKKAPGDLTHLHVVVNKFTKWIEARPLAKIRSKQVVNFVQDIIFCFRVPNSIITDNSTQLTGEKFLDFYDDNNIRVDWAMVAHLCKNGQAEHANGLIL